MSRSSHRRRATAEMMQASHSVPGRSRSLAVELGAQSHNQSRGARCHGDQARNTVTPVAYGGHIDGENQAVEHAAAPAVTGRGGTAGEATIDTDHVERTTP